VSDHALDGVVIDVGERAHALVQADGGAAVELGQEDLEDADPEGALVEPVLHHDLPGVPLLHGHLVAGVGQGVFVVREQPFVGEAAVRTAVPVVDSHVLSPNAVLVIEEAKGFMGVVPVLGAWVRVVGT